MADEKATKEAAPKASGQKKGGQPGGGGKAKGGAPAGATDPRPAVRDGAPRLQTLYEGTIRAKLARQFGLDNPNQVPKLVKIVLNVGMGDASKNPKHLHAVDEQKAPNTAQSPEITRTKKQSSN